MAKKRERRYAKYTEEFRRQAVEQMKESDNLRALARNKGSTASESRHFPVVLFVFRYMLLWSADGDLHCMLSRGQRAHSGGASKRRSPQFTRHDKTSY